MGANMFKSLFEKIKLWWYRDTLLNKIIEAKESQSILEQQKFIEHEHIAKLEKYETQLLEEGKTVTTLSVKRRIAGQICNLRKDLRRMGTTVSLLNAKISILGTSIHNMSILNDAKAIGVPTSEELSESAVGAEQMIEEISDTASLANSLDISQHNIIGIDEEEKQILNELIIPCQPSNDNNIPIPELVPKSSKVKELEPV